MALNILNSLKNTKTRTLVLVVGSTLVAGVIFLVGSIKGGKDPAKENPSKVVGIPRDAESVPGTQTSEQYRKLLDEENKKRAEEAEKDKKSAIPTFKGIAVEGTSFGATTEAKGTSPFGDISKGGFVGGGSYNAKDQQRQLEEDRQKRLDEQKKRLSELEEDKRQKAEMEQRKKDLEAAEKQYQQSVQDAATQMANYAKGATTNWTTFTAQSYVQGAYSVKNKTGKDKGDGTSSTTTNLAKNKENLLGSTAYSGKKSLSEGQILKAGTVLYAVLDTAINSDEEGPVLATVVSGKYKGARLIGKTKLPNNASKVVITFSTMNLPKKKESIAIDAYAIDAETARTAFASDVDNHYLLRYGSLFASAFMEGFGKAVGQQGTTSTDPNGSQIQTKPPLSPKDQIYTALGTVGEKWSKQVEPLFKTPVTVTVEQGLGVGVLLMRDVDITASVAPTPAGQPISSAPAGISNLSNSNNIAATPNQ